MRTVFAILGLALISADPNPEWIKENTAHFEVAYLAGDKSLGETVIGFLEPELARISAALAARTQALHFE